MKYAFIQSERQNHALNTLCRVLKVSRSGYYDWLKRPVSSRIAVDDALLQQIQRVHKAHRGHSGATKTWRRLGELGIVAGKHRVARLRRENGIVAKRRLRYIATTRSKCNHWRAPNLLCRDFTALSPDRVWVGDVTGVPTRQGWLFLAVLVDLFSRQVVGWAMSKANNTELTLSALAMAIEHRGPCAGLVHHSDRGANYASNRYRTGLGEAGILPSMSRKGDCWDNAVAESFFATLEFELIERTPFPSREEARSAVFEFIEVFYNRERSHETLEYKTPLEVEQEYACVA